MLEKCRVLTRLNARARSVTVCERSGALSLLEDDESAGDSR